MVNPLDVELKLRQQTLDALKAGSTAYIEAVRAWNERLASWRTNPAYLELPLAVRAGLGDPRAVIEHNFTLATQALELQRHAAQEWLSAMEKAAEAAGRQYRAH
ncbi:MAG TPA: hypothetical protein PLL54_04870 [Dermatophilaceae bacterium]|nr:hypothetical protein [Dermatophilaceae bacterium]